MKITTACYLVLTLCFFACKKNEQLILPPASQLPDTTDVMDTATVITKQIKTITQHISSPLSSIPYSRQLIIDSFLYDEANRVSVVYSTRNDSLWKVPGSDDSMFTTSTTVVQCTYNSNTATLSSYKYMQPIEEEHLVLHDNEDRIIQDTMPSAFGGQTLSWHFLYSPGFFVSRVNSTPPDYSSDSCWLDDNKNIYQQVTGGTIVKDSLSNKVYVRTFLRSSQYSNIINPVYSNSSVANIRMLLNKERISKYLPAASTHTAYDVWLNLAPYIVESAFTIETDEDGYVTKTTDTISGNTTEFTYY